MECCAGSLLGVTKSTLAYYFQRLREITAYNLEVEFDEYFHGEIEVDESGYLLNKLLHLWFY